MATVRVTTNQGIEDIAAEETADLLERAGLAVASVHPRPDGLAGVVTVDVGDAPIPHLADTVRRALARARSIYHVVLHVGEVAWIGQSLEDLAAEIAALPLTWMESAASFRARCSRAGEHPFHSPDVERAVGTALQARFGTAVDLEHHEVNVRVDITGSRCLCGYQLTGRKGLDRRYQWEYHPRVTLRTTVAYAMLRLAGFVEQPGDIHDPFCGSGTILLEAAACAEDSGSAARVSGSDWSQRAVAGCRRNLRAADRAERVPVEQGDARELAARLGPRSMDYIVTNPPFGIRLAHGTDLGALYRGFLGQAAAVLRPGGTLALLVAKRRGRFNRIVESFDEFRLEHVRVIEIGGVYPGLFVLRRVGDGATSRHPSKGASIG